jgi:hypothetical protein
MVSRPPEHFVTWSAKYCAPVPRPGRFLGHVVTIRHVWRFCAIAGAENVAAAAVAAAVVSNFLLFIDPPRGFWEVRPISGAFAEYASLDPSGQTIFPNPDPTVMLMGRTGRAV